MTGKDDSVLKRDVPEADTLGKPTLKCPKCGEETDGTSRGGGFLLIDTPRLGKRNYCLACWADWIAANIPELVPIDEDA